MALFGLSKAIHTHTRLRAHADIQVSLRTKNDLLRWRISTVVRGGGSLQMLVIQFRVQNSLNGVSVVWLVCICEDGIANLCTLICAYVIPTHAVVLHISHGVRVCQCVCVCVCAVCGCQVGKRQRSLGSATTCRNAYQGLQKLRPLSIKMEPKYSWKAKIRSAAKQTLKKNTFFWPALPWRSPKASQIRLPDAFKTIQKGGSKVHT